MARVLRGGLLLFCSDGSGWTAPLSALANGSQGQDIGIPSACLTDSDSRSRKVVSETLVVLREPAELELRHGLFMGTRVHFGEVKGQVLKRSKVLSKTATSNVVSMDGTPC